MSAEVAGVFEIVPELAFRNVAVRQCLLVSVMGRIMEEIVGTVCGCYGSDYSVWVSREKLGYYFQFQFYWCMVQIT